MSVILKELEKRERLLVEYDEKVARLEAIEEEKAQLKAEIADYDPVVLQAEVEELKEIGYEKGLLERPVEEVAEEVVEETQDEAVASQPVAVPFQ